MHCGQRKLMGDCLCGAYLAYDTNFYPKVLIDATCKKRFFVGFYFFLHYFFLIIVAKELGNLEIESYKCVCEGVFYGMVCGCGDFVVFQTDESGSANFH
jgi:hypothetical protein